MTAVIALVGRPNVGKSTFFNRLTRTREALVADLPGLTRDRHYGTAQFEGRQYLVVDTGGFEPEEREGLVAAMAAQTRLAITEADAICFLVDAKEGLSTQDAEIAQELRRGGKPIYLVVNKMDAKGAVSELPEFYRLGLGTPYTISAAHGHGVEPLLEAIFSDLPTPEDDTADAAGKGPRIAMLGRPNVGKSTLVNTMLGEKRVLVFDEPGTTRDSIRIPYERQGKPYIMIDTAGMRRRARVGEGLEKLSVLKTLSALREADVVLLVLDARLGIAEQDAHLVGVAVELGRPIVVVVNKWDGMNPEERKAVKQELERRLDFIRYAPVYTISALYGTGVGDLYKSIDQLWIDSRRHFSTAELNRALADVIETHQPPMVGGRRIKLRYCHQGGENPITLVFHGNQLTRLPGTYKRYLESAFRRALHLEAVPLRLVFRQGENPYDPQPKNGRQH
ncbi:ribosome biogenesis GTPase Der [Acidithiobacillus ferridurans]|uniref:ribosome biogenesis GTPase Der n=1 Tax=Acidithiobacillus ferridurans TaxID=1232575 RepID=UPI000DE2E8CD|nr:ribosome biogenesis GTPase Der [Acidithiobacillus ferridurans]RBM03364.1 ribosome biogenesis GTPase Der [Acidithiobacillus ferridurans]